MTKLVCIQSRVKDFTVGCVYRDKLKKEQFGDGFERLVDGNRQSDWILNQCGLEVRGSIIGDPFATFKEAKNKKTLLKMLARAYANYAKSRGWGDSKNGAFKSWSGTPYTGLKDWARNMAIGDCMETIIDEARKEGALIDQEYMNYHADESMSYY